MRIPKTLLLKSLIFVYPANAATPKIKLSANKSSVKAEDDAVKFSLSIINQKSRKVNSGSENVGLYLYNNSSCSGEGVELSEQTKIAQQSCQNQGSILFPQKKDRQISQSKQHRMRLLPKPFREQFPLPA